MTIGTPVTIYGWNIAHIDDDVIKFKVCVGVWWRISPTLDPNLRFK